MDNVKRVLGNDRFAAYVGIELVDLGPGHARARMTLGERHLNGIGIAHGAAIFSLADFTFAAASNSHGTVAVAINANISFLKAISSGILTADAREVSINPKLATYAIDIKDETGDLVASFQGMVYRKKDPL